MIAALSSNFLGKLPPIIVLLVLHTSEELVQIEEIRVAILHALRVTVGAPQELAKVAGNEGSRGYPVHAAQPPPFAWLGTPEHLPTNGPTRG